VRLALGGGELRLKSSTGAAPSEQPQAPLSDCTRSVTSGDIAAAAMRDKGLDPDNDPVTRTDFVRRVTLQLNDLVRKGKVEKIGRGRAMRWNLAGV